MERRIMKDIDEIAKSCGKNPQHIRLALREKHCPFGMATKVGDNFNYLLYPKEVYRLFGVKVKGYEETTDSFSDRCIGDVIE
jgi:hypothetical protein